MKITKIMFSVLLMFSVFVMGCGQKDSDIQASVEEKLKANTEMTAPLAVSVNDGVVTLTGECKDEKCKADCEEAAKSVKGVKSVVNNAVVAAAPVQVSTDNALITGVQDATKDHPTVTATVNDGVVTLTGEIKRDQLPKLMQTLNTLNPKKVENQLTIK